MRESKKNRPVELPFGKTIYQTENGQGISTDTAFLVKTVLEEESGELERLLELGSGNGVIAIMLKHYRSNWEISGIEILEHLVKLSQSNSELCGQTIDFIQADIRDYNSEEKYSIIISNPPYYRGDSGKISPVYERAVARHEILCNLEDILHNLGRNLQPGGRSYILNLAIREAEIRELAGCENMILDKIFRNISCLKSKTSIFRMRK